MHHLKKIIGGTCPRTPWQSACRFATCKFPNLKINNFCPPPKSWDAPGTCYRTKKLKNKISYGHDCLSNILIKRVQNVLIEPRTSFINQSLSTGIFPNELRISRVKPLYKSGNASLLSNYIPISVLASISKVYEYVVFKQLLNYMECNKLFYTDQYGFRPGHSTELVAARFVNELGVDMDNYKIPRSVLIDLSKAFDTLNHDILISQL